MLVSKFKYGSLNVSPIKQAEKQTSQYSEDEDLIYRIEAIERGKISRQKMKQYSKQSFYLISLCFIFKKMRA